MFRKAFIALIFTTQNLWAGIELNEQFRSLDLSDHAEFAVVEFGHKFSDYNEFNRLQYHPLREARKILRYGSYIVRTAVSNALPQKSKIVFNHAGECHLITMYKTFGSLIKPVAKTGFLALQRERNVFGMGNNVEITLEPQEQTTLYMHCDSNLRANVKSYLKTKETYIKDQILETFGRSLYYGIVIALLLYNLFLFFSLSYRVYLYYVFFNFTVMMFLLSRDQLLGMFMDPLIESFWPHSKAFFITISNVLGWAFIYSFLDGHGLKKYQSTIIKVIMAVSFLTGILASTPLLLYFDKIRQIFSIISLPYAFIVSWQVARSGYKEAYVLSLASVSFVFSIVFYILALNEVISFGYTQWVVQIGSTLEIMLMSLALAYRIKALEEENLQIHNARWELMQKFSAGVSHSFNNPLSILSLANERFSELFENEKTSLTPEKVRLFSAIRDKSNMALGRLVDVVKQMDQFHRMDVEDSCAHDRESVSFHKVISIIETIYSVKFEKASIHFKVDVPARNPIINMSLKKFVEMVSAPIDNALDALRPNDTVEIKAFCKGKEFELLIVDSGPGIPKELHKNVFMPFYTTKGDGGKEGLGLSRAKQLAQQAGGNIRIDLNYQSCIKITLPVLRIE